VRNLFVFLNLAMAAINIACINSAFEGSHVFPWVNIVAAIATCMAAGFILGGKR
jgi:hypothetical protein